MYVKNYPTPRCRILCTTKRERESNSSSTATAPDEVKSSQAREWKTNDEREKKNERQFEINPFVVKCLFELKLIFLTLPYSFQYCRRLRSFSSTLLYFSDAMRWFQNFPQDIIINFPPFFYLTYEDKDDERITI